MAIDKKIKYEMQGGVRNYLGKQPEVQAPRKWKSSPDKPETELAYITKAEKDLILKANIHGGLEDGPNMGPSGIMSLDSFGDAGGKGKAGGDVSDTAGSKDRGTGDYGVTDKAAQEAYNKNRAIRDFNRQQVENIGKTNRFGFLSPKNIFTGLLGLINPALGFLSKGLANIDLQGLRGYNPDETPMSQDDYEKARKDRQIQGRIDKMTDRMLAGKTFSQTNLDSLMGMTDRFGKSFGTNLGNIDNVRGSNLRSVLNSSVPTGIAPMGVNVPTGIETIDVDLPGNNLMAGLTKMQKKGLDAKKNAVDMGLFSPQDALDSISPFNDPNDPATLNEVKEYYGIV